MPIKTNSRSAAVVFHPAVAPRTVEATSAGKDPPFSAGRAEGIDGSGVPVVVERVLAPLPDVPMHVAQPERIG